MSDGTFEILQHVLSGKSIAWKVPESHLQEVVDEPRAFVDAPEKLGLDGL